MKRLLARHLLALAVAGVLSVPAFAQCELAIPENGINTCKFESALANTSSTITLTNPAVLPTAGSYTVTTSYYDQSINDCAPIVSSANATVTVVGSTVTISLGTGATLPTDYSGSFAIYLNLVSNTGGDNYFIQFINNACTLPFGTLTAMAVSGVQEYKVDWNARLRSGWNWYR